MKLPIINFLMKAAFLVLFPILTWAMGGVDGGGGRTVICRNSQGQITHAELLDLYEAKVIWALESKPVLSNFDEELRAILPEWFRLLRYPDEENLDVDVVVKTIKEKFINQFRFIPEGARLTEVIDSFEPVVPQGCEIKQAINYYNNEIVLVDGEYWRALSPQNQVALILHEMIYKALRDGGETNSINTRKIVGHLFSTAYIPSRDEGIPALDLRAHCYGGIDSVTPHYEFYVYDNPTHGVVLQFMQFADKNLFSKHVALYPGFTIEDFLANGNGSHGGGGALTVETPWLGNYRALLGLGNISYEDGSGRQFRGISITYNGRTTRVTCHKDKDPHR